MFLLRMKASREGIEDEAFDEEAAINKEGLEGATSAIDGEGEGMLSMKIMMDSLQLRMCLDILDI